jgi:outer membrane protein OmpA-like peptidoglycan-associated protein
MKKTVILIISLLATCVTGASAAASAAAADPGLKKITTGNHRVEQQDDMVSVGFDVTVGKRVARSGHTVVYRPYLVNGANRWDLPEVIVQKGRGKISEQRHAWAAGAEVKYSGPTVVRGGESFHYSAEVPRQGWMKGAALEAEIIDMGCCSGEITGSGILASNIDLPTPMVVVMVEPEPEPEPVPPATTGDLLAEELPFVMRSAEFDGTLPRLMFDDDREGALKVYFPRGNSVLDPDRSGNAETLAKLSSAIRKLQSSADSRVEHVVVAGFASPEGSFRLNDRLAWNRASALKKYITDNSNLDGDIIHIYNGVEDWYGLRLLVEKSNMADKQAVLDIMDKTPIADARNRQLREAELKKLDGGRTYDYMMKNFFPELRNASYIKVYYGNR